MNIKCGTKIQFPSEWAEVTDVQVNLSNLTGEWTTVITFDNGESLKLPEIIKMWVNGNIAIK